MMTSDEVVRLIATAYVDAGGDPEELLSVSPVQDRDWSTAASFDVRNAEGAVVRVARTLLEQRDKSPLLKRIAILVPEDRRL